MASICLGLNELNGLQQGPIPFWTASLFDTSPGQVSSFNSMQESFVDCPFVKGSMAARCGSRPIKIQC